ncbi:MAG: ABC transporter substrate-binding protein, partial [Sporichthyaceae bacterium]
MSLTRRLATAAPLAVSAALVLAACGSSNDDQATATQQQPEAAAAAPLAEEAAAPESAAEAPAAEEAPVAKAVDAVEKSTAKTPKTEKAAKAAKAEAVAPKKAAAAKPAAASAPAGTEVKSTESAEAQAANQKIYDEKNGATDIGVTKDSIKLGSINMHGMALGNLITAPTVRGNLATISALNDRGGILGRRMTITDCDDGPGEVSRAKACIKKMVAQDKIFSLVTGIDWATASIHDDLKQNKLPYIGAWAYSQTEWQDPYMFPSH